MGWPQAQLEYARVQGVQVLAVLSNAAGRQAGRQAGRWEGGRVGGWVGRAHAHGLKLAAGTRCWLAVQFDGAGGRAGRQARSLTSTARVRQQATVAPWRQLAGTCQQERSKCFAIQKVLQAHSPLPLQQPRIWEPSANSCCRCCYVAAAGACVAAVTPQRSPRRCTALSQAPPAAMPPPGRPAMVRCGSRE